MAQSQAETVTLRLDQNIDRAAEAALGALGRLEAQIGRERAALGRMEDSLVRAKAKLGALAEGSVDTKAVAAYERQAAAVGALETKLKESAAPAAALVQKLEEARKGLEGLKAAASSKVVNLDAYRKQADLVAGLGGKVGAQKDKIAGLGEKFLDLGKKSGSAGDKLGAANKIVGQLSGGVDVAGGRVAVFGKALASAGPYGALLAIALGLALASVVALTAGFVKAITSADHLRDELLELRVAGVFWWDSQRANTAGALQLQGQIDKLAGSTAVARDKLVDYAVQLKNSYFRGKQLDMALEGMAVAGAAGGDKLASKFLGLAQNARFFGQDLDKLTERFKKKFGAVAEARLLSLGVQFSKFKENIAYVFSGADIEPFLRGLQSVLGLFGRNEKSAQSLRAMITRLTEFAIGMFLRLAIVLVKTYIAIRTNATAWALVGFVIDGITTGIKVVLVVVAAVLAVLIAGAVVFAATWGAMWSGIKLLFDGPRLLALGKSIITGIVEGIKAAAGAIWDALKDAVGGAIDKVKNFLDSHSPSKLTQKVIGMPIGTGIAAGVDASAPEIASSTKDAVRGAVEGGKSAAQAPAQSDSPATSGASVQFTNCTFGGDLTETQLEGWVLRALERNMFDGGRAT